MYQDSSTVYLNPDGGELLLIGPTTDTTNTAIIYYLDIPKTCKFVYMVAVGSGAGGGGGGASLAGTAAAGGGGGAGPAIATWAGPAYMLPRVIEVSIPSGVQGGTGQVQGGAAATAGASGGTTVVRSRYGNNVLTLLNSGATGAGGGGAGSGATGGTAGTAGGIINLANIVSNGLVRGVAGTAGTAGASTTTIIRGSALGCCPGTGGAGVTAGGSNSQAGNITGPPTLTSSLTQRVDGYDFITGMLTSNTCAQGYGGCGGAGAATLGIDGGNGAPGCGGGGGGGAQGTGATGGRGGRGGPGYLYITWIC